MDTFRMRWYVEWTIESFEYDHGQLREQTVGLACLEMQHSLLCRLQIYVCINYLVPEIIGDRLRAQS
jgi:hypothetical protein